MKIRIATTFEDVRYAAGISAKVLGPALQFTEGDLMTYRENWPCGFYVAALEGTSAIYGYLTAIPVRSISAIKDHHFQVRNADRFNTTAHPMRFCLITSLATMPGSSCAEDLLRAMISCGAAGRPTLIVVPKSNQRLLRASKRFDFRELYTYIDYFGMGSHGIVCQRDNKPTDINMQRRGPHAHIRSPGDAPWRDTPGF